MTAPLVNVYSQAHAAITEAFEEIGMFDAEEAAHVALTALTDCPAVRLALPFSSLAAITPPGDEE